MTRNVSDLPRDNSKRFSILELPYNTGQPPEKAEGCPVFAGLSGMTYCCGAPGGRSPVAAGDDGGVGAGDDGEVGAGDDEAAGRRTIFQPMRAMRKDIRGEIMQKKQKGA